MSRINKRKFAARQIRRICRKLGLSVIENLSTEKKKEKEKRKFLKHMQVEFRREDHANTSEN